jgi:hypothetical protein
MSNNYALYTLIHYQWMIYVRAFARYANQPNLSALLSTQKPGYQSHISIDPST